MNLRRRIELYLRRSGMTATQFGVAVMNDKAFVGQLRLMREPRPSTIARVTAWLDEQEAK